MSSKLKLFFRFLKENGALNKYIDKMYKYNITIEKLEKYIEEYPSHMISGIFPWMYSDKVDWRKLNREWQNIIYAAKASQTN